LPLFSLSSALLLTDSLKSLSDEIGNDHQPLVKQSAGELSIRESPTCLVPRTPPQGPKVCLYRHGKGIHPRLNQVGAQEQLGLPQCVCVCVCVCVRERERERERGGE